MVKVGNGNLNPLSINWKGGVGGLWLNRKALIHPRFEIKFTIDINDRGCWDIWSWAMDGFTILLSRYNKNYLKGDGRYLGYKDLYDALAVETDLFWDPFMKDKSWNTCSFHRCPRSNCSAKESGTHQFNLGLVSLFPLIF
ncbi:MAG: hypothetical protein GY861_00370 [bacterium]|nr:hypothetical protein [bacterium]